MMRISLRTLALCLAAGWTVGCQEPAPKPAAAPAPAAQADTGGSARGDFGQPVGPPIDAVLTHAPNVPPPIRRDKPALVRVELEVVEKVMPIADGVDYTFWTFGGEVPGKFIRIRQGDTVEFTLKNHPSSKLPHNIDLHAVTGPGGGAAVTFTAPGKSTTFRFKALNQGLFIYHCATAPVGMHIANGMYGLILVEPPEGLPAVDREYYVMQGDFYTAGKYHEKGLQPFDQQKAIDENATYVLFNGREGALTGDGALKAKVGERVRIFFGNGGPNLVSSFHVIGEVFDKVHTEGGTHYQENVQTTLVPAGGSAIAEYKVEVPGSYVLVDHSIFRAFNKGALGMMQVEGAEDTTVFAKLGEGVAQAEPAEAAKAAAPTPVSARTETATRGPMTLEAQMAAGEKVFGSTCLSCHMANGQGLAGVFPPLAKSDYLMADEARAVGVVLNGLSGPVKVNGTQYNSVMPPQTQLSDEDVANVLTYVRNSWGNKGGPTTTAEVAKVRGGGAGSAAGAH